MYRELLPKEDPVALDAAVKNAPATFRTRLALGQKKEAIEGLTKALSMPSGMAEGLAEALESGDKYTVVFDCVFDPISPDKPNARPRHYENFRIK